MEDGLYQNWRKPREEDMEFSKRRDRKISFRTKVIDGKLASGPRKQLIQIEARKRRLQGKTEQKNFSDVFGHMKNNLEHLEKISDKHIEN